MHKHSIPRPETLASSSRLQLREAVGDLEAVEDRKAASRLALLEADGDLVLRLALHRYEGAEWLQFARVLAEYGIPVMRAWIATGMVFTKCAQKRIAIKRRARVRDEDDASELANETVARAIHAFRGVLKEGRWIAAKGASLKTFFIGQCLFRFGNVYRRWDRELCRATVSDEVVAQELMAARTIAARTLQLAELSREAVRIERDSPAAIAGVMELGFTAIEIAEVLDVSTSAVENRIYHYRKAKTA